MQQVVFHEFLSTRFFLILGCFGLKSSFFAYIIRARNTVELNCTVEVTIVYCNIYLQIYFTPNELKLCLQLICVPTVYFNKRNTQTTKGFYEIQNGCILAHYFLKNTKLDYFANLNDLDISVNENGLPLLIDITNGVQIQLEMQIERDSIELQIEEEENEEAIFFDYEARGLSAYQNEDFNKQTSFPKQASLICFDETE
ncbi:Hypothetical_protein [Hexamita inflata]|uniref:Hypothetical_protein n=1 Tax=Hexamita inflata TaxID=28002 RepID=A0AA86VUH5_9EUKA|nr:Hypothetical protein HINF_LOCUS66363 [Hexamita inflata]